MGRDLALNNGRPPVSQRKGESSSLNARRMGLASVAVQMDRSIKELFVWKQSHEKQVRNKFGLGTVGRFLWQRKIEAGLGSSLD